MTRLREKFKQLADEKRCALVVYLTFGDPTPEVSLEIVSRVAQAGADVVELGVPFSDPNADGPVIQAAMQRAIASGAGLSSALQGVGALRKSGVDVPIVLFGYYNPIFVMGVGPFSKRASEVGVDAVLTVDLPVDEIAELHGPLSKQGLDVIPLVAPTSTDERLAAVKKTQAPFIYYISRTGITGSAFQGAAGGSERIARIRKDCAAPVCVGFGIKTGEDAARLRPSVDGVVVGSALIEKIADGNPDGAADRAAAFVAELRRSIDAA